MAARFLDPVRRGGTTKTSGWRKSFTLAAPGVLAVVLGVGIFGAPVGAVSAKPGVHPAVVTCTDKWKAAVSGSWSTAADWSTGVVPTSSDNVCIKLAGTYKVTISGNVSAGTISLGGTSGTQTLLIKGTPAANSGLNLSTATGSTIGVHGALKLKSKNVAGTGYALLGGAAVTIDNSGTIQTSGGLDNNNYLRAGITNGSTGKLKINGVTVGDASGGAVTITNNGAFSVGSAGKLALSNGDAFTQSGGTLTNGGSFTETSGVFTQSGGTDSGTPVSIISGSLADSAMSGTYTFDIFNNDNLSGTIPSGQTVDAIGNPTYNTTLLLAANLTNDGTLELNSQTTSGSGFAQLDGPTHTVTNAGTIETVGGTVNTNYLRTNITNNSGGSIDINGGTTGDASGGATTITNNGTFAVASGGSLALTNADSFTQSGGTFTNGGTFSDTSGTFTQSGGTDSGTPVSIISGTLADSAMSGTYTFDLFNTDTLSGTIPSGQTVDGIGNPTYNTTLTLGANLTNDGTLELDSLATAGSGFAQLDGPTHNVINAGTLETVGGTVSTDYLRVNITNNNGASLDINGGTTGDASGGATTITNNGTFSVASGGSLALTNGDSFTQSGGTFANGGTFSDTSGTFTQSGGTDSGTPASIISGTLADSAMSGTYTFDLFNTNTVSGTIPSGQTVDAIGNPTYNTTVTLGANLTNDGTLELDSSTAAGSGYAQLQGPTHTVINGGTFETAGGTVSTDYIRANITNNSGGTIAINGGTTDDASGGATTITNNGTFSVGDGDKITISNGSIFDQSSTGTFEPTVDSTTNSVSGIVGGSDTVAGTLNVQLVGSVPATGTTFNVINTATSVTGTFSTVSGSHFTVTYTSTSVIVHSTGV